MAAESNTPVDIEIWIEKVINSCTTARHFYNVDRLIGIYIKRLRDEGLPYYQYDFIRDKFESIADSKRDNLRNKN